jgi:uncharacterized protein YkwD
MRDSLLFGSLLVVGIVIAYGLVAPTERDSEFSTVSDFDENEIREKTFHLQNELRQNDSIQKVSRSSSLEELAQQHAEYMAQSGDYTHGDLEKRMKYDANCSTYGEVIARGSVLTEMEVSGGETYLINSNEKAAIYFIKSWGHSTQHKRNILTEKFTHAGVGIAINKNGGFYGVVDYCKYSS